MYTIILEKQSNENICLNCHWKQERNINHKLIPIKFDHHNNRILTQMENKWNFTLTCTVYSIETVDNHIQSNSFPMQYNWLLLRKVFFFRRTLLHSCNINPLVHRTGYIQATENFLWIKNHIVSNNSLLVDSKLAHYWLELYRSHGQLCNKWQFDNFKIWVC